jgi:quinol monooxygenase YgiN
LRKSSCSRRKLPTKLSIPRGVLISGSYADKKALAIHGSSEKFKQFSAALKNEDLVSGPMQVKFVAKAAGFSRL